MGTPGDNTVATISLTGNAITPEFFGVLWEAFKRHRYRLETTCTLVYENPDWNGQVDWNEVTDKIAGEAGTLWAILLQEPDSISQLILSYSGGLRRQYLQINSFIGLARRMFFDMQEKEHAFALQALCLELHERLGAVDTIAANENGLVLFHFSKEEWKLLEDFPVDVD